MGVRSFVRQFTKEGERKMERNLDRVALVLVQDITEHWGKDDAPDVGEGFLKRSITWEKPAPLTRWVGSSLQPRDGQPQSYAYYFEFGFTHKKSGKKIHRPWLRPAVDRSSRLMLNAFAKGIT